MYHPKKMREKSLGLWLSSFNSLYLEAILSTNSYDWVALDLEHSGFTETEARDTFMLCERYGIHTFARLKGHDHLQGRKMLDMGATGLIIPVVNSAEELKKLTKHFFYPPRGVRGVCLSRINEFGQSFDEYYKNFRPILVPQIESRSGVENIDEILSLPYVDAIFIGPYDLSADLGHPGEFHVEVVKNAIDRIKTSALKHKKSLGIHIVWPNIDDLKKRYGEGFSFVAYGTDIILLKHALKEVSKLRKDRQ